MNRDQDLPLHLAIRSGDVNKVSGVLLGGKLSINSIDDYGKTPLELACELGNLDIIKTLIDHTVQNDKGTFGDKLLKIALNYEKDEVILFIITKLKCDPNIKGGYNNRSPLHVACKKGNLSLIRTLIQDYNADLNDEDIFGNTPFTLALENERDEVMLILIGCDPTNIKGSNGVSPLHVACKKGNLNLVKTLICDYHADLDPFGKIPFTLAFENERDEVMLVLISEFGCVPTNIKGKFHVSPLHVACKKGNLSLVRTLLHDYHADLNDKDVFGNTPFTLALENERDEVMLVLISEFGYDPTNIKGRSCVSPLHVACKKGNLSLVRTLIHDYHANLNDKDPFGKMPFTLALENERDEVMLVLISEFGYDPSKSKYSLLLVACKKGNFSLLKSLVYDYHMDFNDKDCLSFKMALENERDEIALRLFDYGCDPKAKDEHGRSLLHIACEKGRLGVVRALILNQHLELNDQDSDGNTPLMLTIKKNHGKVALTLLTQYGCYPNTKDNDGNSPLHVACMKGNLTIFQALVSHGMALESDMLILAIANSQNEVVFALLSEYGCDPNTKDNDGNSPLHVACIKGNLDIVKVLISHGADLNSLDSGNDTPITLAVKNGREEVVLTLIREYGCDPNTKDSRGRSLLRLALEKRRYNLFKKLMNTCNFDLNAQDDFNETPLMLAVIYESIMRRKYMSKNFHHLLLEEVLLHGKLMHDTPFDAIKPEELVSNVIRQYNVDPNLKYGEDGDTLFMKAVRYERCEIMKLLISDHGCDPNIKGYFPLHVACKKSDLNLIEGLIKHGADPNAIDEFGNTPLMLAVKNNSNKNVLSVLTQYGCDPNTKDNDGNSPLHVACIKGNLDVVKTLISHGADQNSLDSNINTPITLAVKNGWEEVALTLIREYGCDPYTKDSHGRSLLHLALEKRRYNLFETLMNTYNFDLNARDNFNETPLMLAVKYESIMRETSVSKNFHHLLLEEVLLHGKLMHDTPLGAIKPEELVSNVIRQYNVDPNLKYAEDDDTLFMKAVRYERCEIMKLLISDYGCDPNIKGFFPLHVACKKGDLSLVETLITHGADLNAKDEHGYAPLMTAVEYGRYEIIKSLIDHGCVKRYFPLHVACTIGDFSLVQTLITNGIDLNAKDEHGYTPLMTAVEYQRHEIVKLLICNYGCDIKGCFPLHVACKVGNLRSIQTLITHGADLNAKDEHGHTPLMTAVEYQRHEIVKLLICNYGCDIKGCFPLHVACKVGNLRSIQTLITHGADLNALDEHGYTPVMTAVEHGRCEIVKSLICDYGCDPNIKGCFPLFFFCKIGDARLVETLINRGADVTGHDISVKASNGWSLLHHAVSEGHVEMLKMLVSKFGMSLLVVDEAGDTPLHVCAELGHYDCVRSLLEDFQSPIYIRNRAGKTPIDVARSDVKPLFDDYLSHSSQAMQADYQSMQQLAKKKFSGAHHITKLFVVGHPGAGKSSLVEALKREGFLKSFSRVSEKSVPPHTAGIVPSIHTSPSYGRVQFYDFAGDPEYYSSHAAILEKIFQSKVGTTICIIVLDLQENDEEIEKKFLYWSTFISNSCRNPQNPPSLLVIGSHSDLLPNQREKNDSVQSLLSKYNKESVYFSLDCCYPRSDNLYALRKHIKTISEKSKPYSLSQEMSVLLGLLEKDFQSVTACTAHVLVDHINQVGLCLPRSMTHLHPLLLQLQDIGELLIVGGEEDDSYLILSVSQLTNEVHKKLFAVDAFPNKPKKREFNIGLLPESFFQTVLPEYITKKCLIQLQYCQEVSPVEIDPDLSILPNLNASADVATSPDQSLLFFPALCTVSKSAINWHIPPTSYSIGWLARCSRPRDYFPPRFLHVLLLRVALKFTVLAPSPPVHHALDIKPQCKMWKTGVHWLMEEGVECTVELVDVSKSVVVALRGQGQNYEKYGEIMCKIISCVMEAKAEFCPSITPDFFLLDSTDTTECFSDGELFSMYSIEKVLMSPEGKEVCLNVSGDKTMSCKKLTFIRKLIYWYSLFPIEFFPVFQLLDKISAKWHDLGLYLCLPKNTLDVIQEENPSVQKRLKEMVSAWMNSSIDPPCWWHLAKALRDMEMGRLADEIEGNHGQLVQYSLTPLTLYIIPPQVTTLKCRRSSLIQSAMLRSQRKISWSRLLVWWGPSGHPWPPFCL